VGNRDPPDAAGRESAPLFTGWMFFDDEHDDEAENTAPTASNKWRATACEVHPVTAIETVSCFN